MDTEHNITDPDTALGRALLALTRHPNAQTIDDLDEAREALTALADWLDRGGYLPRWPLDGPTMRDTIAATTDSTELVAQVTRVGWMIDAIDRDTDASRRRVLLAVNALRFTCVDCALAIERVNDRLARMRAERKSG